MFKERLCQCLKKISNILKRTKTDITNYNTNKSCNFMGIHLVNIVSYS